MLIDLGTFDVQEPIMDSFAMVESSAPTPEPSQQENRLNQMILTFPNGMCLKIYLLIIGLSANLDYYLCCNPVDMRNGFDSLAGIVRNVLKQDPASGSVFIFINRAGTHIKLL